jgi:DNA polymerase-3 subunit delta
MLYILYGRDSFSLRQALAELKASLDRDGMLQSNTSLLDGRQASPEELMALCNAVPFLSSHRLVIVEGLLSRLEGTAAPRGASRRSRSRGGKPGSWQAMADYVDGMPATTVLVLVDDEVSPANLLLAALRGKGQVRHFPPLQLNDVPAWVRRRAQEVGLSLTQRAVTLLVDLVGNDLWALAGELDKLIAYAVGRPVDEADVQALVSAARDVTVFPLVDSIVEGRTDQAMRLLRQFIAQGNDHSHVFAMVLRQYRHLVLARELIDQGAPSSDIGQRLHLRSPYALERLMEQAHRYDLPRLKAAHQRLLATDAAIKRGIYNEDLALELLLLDLAAVARPRSAARP